MSQTVLHELANLGQSVWLDFINRRMIENGELKSWIEQGLRGQTSNPSIFNQVISQTSDYDERIIELREAGKNIFAVYDALTIRDIQDACDLFRPVYEKTDGLDGYVSLEINPELAHDAQASIKEGQRLYSVVKRPNVMIKVPATDEGFPVIQELLANGINVNVTLIFSRKQYVKTAAAYVQGIKDFLKKGGDVRKVRSVASVFVSRIDSLIDQRLQDMIKKTTDQQQKQVLQSLLGKAAVANSRLIFETFKEEFAREDFQQLKKKGAHVQRVLWGSTSTKNPDYRDVKYVEELIADPTVNTIPENTLKAMMNHGQAKPAFGHSAKIEQQIIANLKAQGIDIDAVCDELLVAGVEAFVKAFRDLLKAIEDKAQKLCASS